MSGGSVCPQLSVHAQKMQVGISISLNRMQGDKSTGKIHIFPDQAQYKKKIVLIIQFWIIFIKVWIENHKMVENYSTLSR